MKVLACFNCKEYVPIHLNNVLSEQKEASFRRAHKGHAIFTTELGELHGFSIDLSFKEQNGVVPEPSAT